jgi:hypothetical protein
MHINGGIGMKKEELNKFDCRQDERFGNCIYKLNSTGTMIMCARCSRVRAIRNEKGEWENLY